MSRYDILRNIEQVRAMSRLCLFVCNMLLCSGCMLVYAMLCYYFNEHVRFVSSIMDRPRHGQHLQDAMYAMLCYIM